MNISKDMTQKIKGIAILLMVYHHLFGFPDRLLSGISYWELYIKGVPVQLEIATAAKLCVSIYAIITGYGLARKKELSWKYIRRKILPILSAYWLSLIILGALYLMEGIQLDMKQILLNFSTISTDMNSSAWYLNFYILACITMMFLKKIFDRFYRSKWIMLILFWGGNVLIDHIGNVDSHIMHYFHYMPVMIIGYMMGKDVKDSKKINKMLNSKKALIFAAIGFGICIIMRKLVGSSVYSLKTLWIFTPILFLCFIVFVIKFSAFPVLGKVLLWCGKYSTEFWLLNSIFTSGIYWIQKIVFIPKISIIILIWAMLLMYPFGYFMKTVNEEIWKTINENTSKI